MKFIIMVLFAFSFYGCVTEYDLDIDSKKQSVVINAFLSNHPEEFYVRVTRSYLIPDSARPSESYPAPIENAIVYLCEDNSDSVLIQYASYFPEKGHYFGENIAAKPNHYYTLKVKVDGITYESSNNTPEAFQMDSLKIVQTNFSSDGKNIVRFIPRVYFKRPQNKNDYYLMFSPDSLNINRTINFYSEDGKLAFFSSEFDQKSSVVVDLENSGVSGYSEGDPATNFPVSCTLISKDTYNFYQSLIYQVDNDGGAFSPAPSSPPTSFNNGAQGFFVVTNSSYLWPIVK